MKIGCWLVASVFFFMVIVASAVGMEYAGYTWYQPWVANKKTEILRNTNQYVTTQQRAMQDAWQRYNDPDATEGQKQAALQDWCVAAGMVDDEYVVPSDAKIVARQDGCWNGY